MEEFIKSDPVGFGFFVIILLWLGGTAIKEKFQRYLEERRERGKKMKT